MKPNKPMEEFSISEDDIDPSSFNEEELRELLFNGVFCAKIVEAMFNDERSIRAAYNVIKHFDDVPHERRPSDLIVEKALKD